MKIFAAVVHIVAHAAKRGSRDGNFILNLVLHPQTTTWNLLVPREHLPQIYGGRIALEATGTVCLCVFCFVYTPTFRCLRDPPPGYDGTLDHIHTPITTHQTTQSLGGD